jgi:hypothetical protein
MNTTPIFPIISATLTFQQASDNIVQIEFFRIGHRSNLSVVA